MSSNYAAVAKSLWLNTAHITKTLDASLGAVHGVGFTEYMVLEKLADAPNQALRRIDIADAIERTASGVTRLLQPMEKIGLISKETNARDARVSLVKLTPSGKELFENASLTLEQRSSTLLKNLAKTDARSLINLLKLI